MPIRLPRVVGARSYTRVASRTDTSTEGAGMRFLHSADWQLGMTRRFLNGDAQPRYSAARRDAVAAIGSVAAGTGAEFVVVAGDVFEHNQLDPRVISQSLEVVRGIGVPVYLLPGNHDPLDASSVYTSPLFVAECPENVVVLDRAGVHDVRAGLQIVAAPWRSKRPTTDLAAEVLAGLPADGVTRILVAHGGVDILEPDRDHVLAVDIDEDDDARPVRVDAHRVGRWRFVTLRRSVDSSRDVADLDINLDLLPDKDRTVVRHGLTGSLTVTDRAALDACLDKYARLFASLQPWDRHTDLAVIPADGEFDDLGIGGFAAAAVRELVAAAREADGERADDAQAALALLLRLATRPGSAA